MNVRELVLVGVVALLSILGAIVLTLNYQKATKSCADTPSCIASECERLGMKYDPRPGFCCTSSK